MNIQQALQSGLAFKRPNHYGWFTKIHAGKYVFDTKDTYYETPITDEDLLADDWLVKEERVEITLTKSEFLKMWSESVQDGLASISVYPGQEYQRAIEVLMDKLGFK